SRRTLGASLVLAALPFLAANITSTSGKAPWPRYRLFQRGAHRIAVVGLVGKTEFELARERAGLLLRSGRDALAEVVGELRAHEEGPPDVIIALSSGDGKERAQLSAVDGIDLVVADFARDDGLPLRFEVSPSSPREQSRHNAVFAPVFHRAGLGHIALHLGERPNDAPAVLERMVVTIDPLLDQTHESAAASRFAASLRTEEERRVRGGSEVLVPALRSLAHHGDAEGLLYGPAIAILGEARRRERDAPLLWTDDLWLRLVANAAATGVHADVALVRNMRRAPLVTGPLSRGLIEAWLRDGAGLVSYDVSGSILVRLAERLAQQPATFDDASAKVAVAGLDPARKQVSGRPIDSRATYRLALDERLVGEPQFAGLFEGTDRGDRVPMHEVVVAALPETLRATEPFADRSHMLVNEWRLGLEALELRGSAVRTSPTLSTLAPSREARAQARELVLASVRVLAFGVFDGPGFAWDNQLRLQYDSTFFTDDLAGPKSLEPIDDIVASSEFRLEHLRLRLRTDAPTLSSFANLTVDSEFTPVVGSARQAQVRESVGLSWRTGGAVQELRAGLLLQQDASLWLDGAAPGGPALDVGALGLARLRVALTSTTVLDSVNDLRWFAPIGAALRPFDLSLRAQSVTRLSTPLGHLASAFLFADVVGMTSQKDPLRLEWNAILGGGLAFASVLRL
ncbi:MAG: hypothetical protein ACO3JL_12020, partial [Myxococcota bacterium]